MTPTRKSSLRGRIRRSRISSVLIITMLLLLMTIGCDGGIPRTITTTETNEEEPQKPLIDATASRLHGFISLMLDRPSLCVGMLIRIAIAMALELVLDGFLKTVVTPAIVATGVGVVVAPATFLVGQALQPIVHSVAFIVFDDRFLQTVLEATGIKETLPMRGKEWHKMSLLEGIITRYFMKSMAASCLGLAGVFTIVPVLGHALTAFLTGWVVTWDYVYVPLSGMGYKGPLQQFQTVWHHLSEFQWYGFWAVLVEEIPLLGPTCHVYNVYSAAFFLERVYSLKNNIGGDDATAVTVESDYSWTEL